MVAEGVTKGVTTPTKYLGTLLALLYENKREKGLDTILPSDKGALHSIFYDLGKSNDEIFRIFEFDERKAYPYSKVLDEAFTNIQSHNAISRLNPPMTKFIVQQEIISYKNRFDVQRIDSVGKIAAELASKV